MPAGIAATAALLVAAGASAGPSGLVLSWSAPPDCPQVAQVDAAVARMLGEETERPDPITVDGVITRTGDGWQVALTRSDGGTRLLTGTSCRAVSEAAVVVLALMVDPLARTDVTPTLEPDVEPRFGLQLHALGDTHALPRLAPGLALGGAVRLGAGFWLELHALAFLPQSRTVDENGAGATVLLFAGSLGARRDFAIGPLTLAPLLSFEAGAQRGRSFGVSDPAVNVAVWTAVRAGALVALTFGMLRAGIRAEAAIPVTRPRFVIAGVGEAHTSALVSGRGTFFLELLFPPRAAGGSSN